MKVSINGKTVELDHELSITDFLQEQGLNRPRVAIEHNLAWVKPDDWAITILHENDRLEIVHLIAGG